MLQQPEVTDWLKYDEEGVGGVIPEDARKVFYDLNEPKEGIPSVEGAWTVISDPMGIEGEWGDDKTMFQAPNGQYYIVQGGFLYEVTPN